MNPLTDPGSRESMARAERMAFPEDPPMLFCRACKTDWHPDDCWKPAKNDLRLCPDCGMECGGYVDESDSAGLCEDWVQVDFDEDEILDSVDGGL